MKTKILVTGTCYYRREGTKKVTTGPFEFTTEVDLKDVGNLTAFVQHAVVKPHLAKNPPYPGYINWQTCDAKVVEPEIKKSKKVIIE